MQQKTLPDKIEVVDDALAEILRAKSPAERIAIVAEANRTARILAAAGARYLHPDWEEAQIQAEVVRRVSGGTT
jgi:regulator of protease activity HflC (stomatin/prohibitin superfamily)